MKSTVHQDMRTLRARYAGAPCPLCETEIAIGDKIVRGASLDGSSDSEAYRHARCAEAARQKFLIENGETARSRKRRDRRRKGKRREPRR